LAQVSQFNCAAIDGPEDPHRFWLTSIRHRRKSAGFSVSERGVNGGPMQNLYRRLSAKSAGSQRLLPREDKVVEIDAPGVLQEVHGHLPDDDVAEEERTAVARQVADRIIAKLKEGTRDASRGPAAA
jgi:hypothetical protein